MGKEERLRTGCEGCSITRWAWVTSHTFGSMIREQKIPWKGSSRQITEQNHISLKQQFWSTVGLWLDRCSSHNHTVTVGLYFSGLDGSWIYSCMETSHSNVYFTHLTVQVWWFVSHVKSIPLLLKYPNWMFVMSLNDNVGNFQHQIKK